MEAGIHAICVYTCVVNTIGVDAKYGNVPGIQNQVKGQLGAKTHFILCHLPPM